MPRSAIAWDPNGTKPPPKMRHLTGPNTSSSEARGSRFDSLRKEF